MQQMDDAGQNRFEMDSPKGQSGAAEGIVVVDLSLHPIAFDEGGRLILNQLAGGNSQDGAAGLPPEVEERLRSARNERIRGASEWVSARNGQYLWRAFLMKPQNGDISQPILAIHIKREHSLYDAVRHVCREYHLTGREEQTLLCIAMGLTTRQVAARMGISPNTVNAFLRLIMVKMGVTTRAGVLGRLLDVNNSAAGADS